MTSSTVSPTVAAATELTPSEAPPIHSPTVSRNAAAVIFSSRERGPSLASSLRAASGASGVSLVSGGVIVRVCVCLRACVCVCVRACVSV